MPLRLAPLPPAEPGCAGCSRRSVLHGIAVTAATMLVGCESPASEGTPDAPDTPPVPDAPTVPGDAAAPQCAPNICIDLGDPANEVLTQVDGSMAVNVSATVTLIAVRISSTAFEVVSKICTHQQCPVSYDKPAKILKCPCHGSQYRVTGEVIMGPATEDLRRYTTQFDAANELLTIML